MSHAYTQLLSVAPPHLLFDDFFEDFLLLVPLRLLLCLLLFLLFLSFLLLCFFRLELDPPPSSLSLPPPPFLSFPSPSLSEELTPSCHKRRARASGEGTEVRKKKTMRRWGCPSHQKVSPVPSRVLSPSHCEDFDPSPSTDVISRTGKVSFDCIHIFYCCFKKIPGIGAPVIRVRNSCANGIPSWWWVGRAE